MPVGFIGLGELGQPTALNLVRAGTPLVVWNCSPQRSVSLRAAGAEVAIHPAEVFRRADPVLITLGHGGELDTVLGRGTPGFARMVAGRTVVQLGSAAPAYVRRLAADVRAAGGSYVAAPVTLLPAAGAATAVLVRPAAPDDAPALQRMLDRCSEQTRYRRFHGVVREFPARYLHSCLHGADGHAARVAEVVGRADTAPTVVGFASVGPVPDVPDALELGVLVEDAWQRRGLGRALTDELLLHARAVGVACIRLQLCRAQPDLLAHLLTSLPVLAKRASGCDVSVDLAPRRPAWAQAR